MKLTKRVGAWGAGVKAYMFELVEELPETISDAKEAERIMLNGADSWDEYSYGGCSLIYDGDIAERLCTERALKLNHYGEKNPNSSETWLDIQAKALRRASAEVKRIIRNN